MALSSGPWRFFPVTSPSLIGHNDIAPYNVCFEGDELVGVMAAGEPGRSFSALAGLTDRIPAIERHLG